MTNQGIYANPFALMMDPQAVFEAMQRSERLNRLQSRVCRPLDKPLIPLVNDTAAYDADVDSSEVEAEAESKIELSVA